MPGRCRWRCWSWRLRDALPLLLSVGRAGRFLLAALVLTRTLRLDFALAAGAGGDGEEEAEEELLLTLATLFFSSAGPGLAL